MVRIYVPTVAKFKDDLEGSYTFCEELKDKGYDAGLMLLIFGGRKGLEGEDKEKNYNNFKELTDRVGELPVIVMASNMPLEDLDFYHKPSDSVAHIKAAVDFTRDLPNAKDRVLSFHLNTLLNADEWDQAGKTSEEKYSFFTQKFNEVVWPALKEVADYAKQQNIELKVETTPAPEFGDCDDEKNKLGNPYPLFSGRGFEEVRNCGLGIVLDLCHTFTFYRCVPLLSELGNKFYDTYKGVAPEDIAKIQGQNLMQDLNALNKGDIIHLNDSKDLFMPKNNLFHKEGVALGEGEINNLPELIKKAIEKDLRIVFEVNETDFKNRPNLRKSLDYFMRNA